MLLRYVIPVFFSKNSLRSPKINLVMHYEIPHILNIVIEMFQSVRKVTLSSASIAYIHFPHFHRSIVQPLSKPDITGVA